MDNGKKKEEKKKKKKKMLMMMKKEKNFFARIMFNVKCLMFVFFESIRKL